MSAPALLWTAIRPRPRGPKVYFVRTGSGAVVLAILGLPDRDSLPTLSLSGTSGALGRNEVVAYCGPVECPPWRS